jgi:hypothetical protein
MLTRIDQLLVGNTGALPLPARVGSQPPLRLADGRDVYNYLFRVR